jgi:hypothetical protein
VSADAQKCTKCDWGREKPAAEEQAASPRTRDWAALWLSLVPGLGHLYKGHLILGGAIFFIIGPLVLGLSLSVMPGTLGLSMLIPLFFLIAVMLHAYQAPDKRGDVIRRAKEIDQAGVARRV